MEGCPACGRPVAMARASCVYCGASLEPRLVADAARIAQPPSAPPADRVLVVLELEASARDALVRGARLSAYEAGLLLARGGYHLLRALPPAEAEAEAARLAAEGLRPRLVPEAEARRPPFRAARGAREGSSLELRGEQTSVALRREDLLLVVAGPIERQRQTDTERRRVATATLEQSYCFHLHRRHDPRAIEIDATDFEPGTRAAGSTRLTIERWLDEVADGVPRDERFRFETPALAPALPEPASRLSGVNALRATPGGGRQPAVILDNLAQFRFYSGWRAGVERRRGGRSALEGAPSLND